MRAVSVGEMLASKEKGLKNSRAQGEAGGGGISEHRDGFLQGRVESLGTRVLGFRGLRDSGFQARRLRPKDAQRPLASANSVHEILPRWWGGSVFILVRNAAVDAASVLGIKHKPSPWILRDPNHPKAQTPARQSDNPH